MRQVLEKVQDLRVEPLLLQIDLDGSNYKIRCGDKVRKLICDSEHQDLEIESVVNLVKREIAQRE